ncbi:MAG: exosortase/archaeosortase family protein [Planctomycetes bacterium]|nr:exosortase/archaeosortase family protein [Planctomycetota bacterium]
MLTSKVPAPNTTAPIVRAQMWPLAVLSGLLVWAYLPMLSVFADKWLNDPQYSHGLLVPLFSAFLIRRAWQSGTFTPRPMPIVGCLLLFVALAMRAIAGSMLFHQLDAASLLLALVAINVAAGGWPLIKRTGPAIAFLVFMIPLPYELERNVGQPLKTTATVCSTFLLQTLGQPALRDGNLILIDEVRLGVVDACSGLKMLMTFAAFSIGAVLLMDRTRFEKFMIVLGIVPIAIAANVLRITATGMCYVFFTNKNTTEFMHDALGYLMMPIGLGLLALELWVLTRLVVETGPARTPVAKSEPVRVHGLSPMPA